jgi:hypothetical protein
MDSDYKRTKSDSGMLYVNYTKGEPLGVMDSVARKYKLYFVLNKIPNSLDKLESLFLNKLTNSTQVRIINKKDILEGFIFFTTYTDTINALGMYARNPTLIHPTVKTLERAKIDATFVINHVPNTETEVIPEEVKSMLLDGCIDLEPVVADVQVKQKVRLQSKVIVYIHTMPSSDRNKITSLLLPLQQELHTKLNALNATIEVEKSQLGAYKINYDISLHVDIHNLIKALNNLEISMYQITLHQNAKMFSTVMATVTLASYEHYKIVLHRGLELCEQVQSQSAARYQSTKSLKSRVKPINSTQSLVEGKKNKSDKKPRQ